MAELLAADPSVIQIGVSASISGVKPLETNEKSDPKASNLETVSQDADRGEKIKQPESISPEIHTNKRKQNMVLTENYLFDVFNTAETDNVGIVQILDQRSRKNKNGDSENFICLSDGINLTWQVVGENEDISSELEILPNYSVIQLNEVELYNGIRILIKDFVIKSDETDEPIVQISTLKDISPNFLRDLRVQKGLTDVAGKLNPKHPHFSNTPVKLRTRSRKPLASSSKEQLSGGFECEVCKRFYKKEGMLKRHKCK